MRDRRFKRPPQVAPAKTPSETIHVQFAANVKPGPPAFMPIQLPNVPEERTPRPGSRPPADLPTPLPNGVGGTRFTYRTGPAGFNAYPVTQCAGGTRATSRATDLLGRLKQE